MRRSFKSAAIYKNVKRSQILEKTAEDLLSEDYIPAERAQVNDQVYDDLEGMGYMDPESLAIRDYLMSLQYPAETLSFSDYTPDEYFAMMQDPYEGAGLGMGLGAYNLYEDMAPMELRQKMSSEDLSKTLNEVVKVGRAGYCISQMKKSTDKEKVKVACEMDLINKDYLVNLLGRLVSA